MWKQIAEDLRQKIDAGELGADGKPLPTELDLQADYGASRNTVRDAIKWLAARNLVYTRSGQGTFVKQQAEPFVTKLSPPGGTDLVAGDGQTFTYEVLNRSRRPAVPAPRVEILQADNQTASELGLREGTTIISRHQGRLIDGVPYSRQTTFYPMRLAVEQGAVKLLEASDIRDGAVNYLRQLGVAEVGQRDEIAVRPPDNEECAFFGIPDDGRIAVIEFTRTGYDESGTPLRVTVTTYPADRNQFVMTTGKVPSEAQADEA
jgi:GntR family transcriptional regulator